MKVKLCHRQLRRLILQITKRNEMLYLRDDDGDEDSCRYFNTAQHSTTRTMIVSLLINCLYSDVKGNTCSSRKPHDTVHLFLLQLKCDLAGEQPRVPSLTTHIRLSFIAGSAFHRLRSALVFTSSSVCLSECLCVCQQFSLKQIS